MRDRTFVARNRDDFILLTVEFYRAGEPYSGVLIVGQKLPNHRPERIAHALKGWAETRIDVPENFGALDFL